MFCIHAIQVSPTSGTTAAISVATGTCDGASSTVLPGVDFTVSVSGACDDATTVTYPSSSDQIASMIRSTTGTCSQRVSLKIYSLCRHKYMHNYDKHICIIIYPHMTASTKTSRKFLYYCTYLFQPSYFRYRILGPVKWESLYSFSSFSLLAFSKNE